MPTENLIPPGANVFGNVPGANHMFPFKAPGAINFYGHSYMTGGNGVGSSAGAGLMNLDQTIVRMLTASLGVSDANMLNFAQDGAALIDDNSITLPGGHVQALQTYSPINVRQAVSAKAPWTNDFGLCVLMWGINDINKYAGGSQNALFRKAYQEALRTVISRCRSAAVYEGLTDTNTFYSGGGLGGANWSSVAIGTTNSGAGFARTATVGANVVIATPADYDGECISLGFIGRKGATGGQANILIDGVIVDRINTSNVIASTYVDRAGSAITNPNTALVLTRRYKVAKNVAHTITITTTAIDGNFDYNFYQFEAAEANPIIVSGISRLKLYLAGLAPPADALVDDWNQAILEVLPEFPGPIEFADINDAINQSTTNSAYVNGRLSWDTTHPSESGYRHIVVAILDAWARISRKNNLGAVTSGRGNYGIGFSVPVAQVVPSYYILPGPAAPNGATGALTASVLIAIPYIITRACTLRNIVFDSITVAGGGGAMQLGLMSDKLNSGSPATISGPQLKIYDWGSFTATVATPKAFAVPAAQSRILLPGIYWLIIIPGAGTTITTTQIAGSNPYISSLSLFTPRPISAVAITYTQGGGFTVVPPILPAAGVSNANIAAAPFVAFDVASVP